jgi:predicted DNA-binding transcriptional regulator AlpA
MAAMSDKSVVVSEVAKKLGMTTTTLYKYINGDGSLKEIGEKLIKT